MSNSIVELVKALAWPVSTFLIALTFYEPLGRLLEALGSRATKLSLFKIEVELASAASPNATPSLDSIRNPQLAPMNDSSRMLFKQVQDVRPADYAVINIGNGDEWLTSRLFIGAAMLQRMRGIRSIVFVGRVGGVDRKFLAVSSVTRARWTLSQNYPWLEAAFACASADAIIGRWGGGYTAGQIHSPQVKVNSDQGAINPTAAEILVDRFIQMLQDTSAGTDAEWIDLDANRKEHATWVTESLLKELLPPEDFQAWE